MKRESQVDELYQLKLKTHVLHGNRDEEAHMTADWVHCCRVAFGRFGISWWLSFLELAWMNYVWL